MASIQKPLESADTRALVWDTVLFSFWGLILRFSVFRYKWLEPNENVILWLNMCLIFVPISGTEVQNPLNVLSDKGVLIFSFFVLEGILLKCIFIYFLFLWLHQVLVVACAAAAAKSLQSCPTLCNPRDGSPPGSPVPGILQARTLEWVAISFSNAWKWKVKVKSLSCVGLLATPWTAAYQAPPSMGFSRQEYWSGVPLPSPILYSRSCFYLFLYILYILVCIC